MRSWVVVTEHKGRKDPRSVVVRAKHLRGAVRRAHGQLGPRWRVVAVLPGPVMQGRRYRRATATMTGQHNTHA